MSIKKEEQKLYWQIIEKELFVMQTGQYWQFTTKESDAGFTFHFSVLRVPGGWIIYRQPSKEGTFVPEPQKEIVEGVNKKEEVIEIGDSVKLKSLVLVKASGPFDDVYFTVVDINDEQVTIHQEGVPDRLFRINISELILCFRKRKD